MLTRHKLDNAATKRRFKPKSTENGGPYRIKSQRCGRHTHFPKELVRVGEVFIAV
jgi:hypothetical protein